MKYLAFALTIPLVLAVSGCDSTAPETPKAEVAVKPAAASVSAAELHRAYKTNEVAADGQYKGKEVRVTGKLISVSKDFMEAIYLTIDPGTDMGELEAIHAYFDDSAKAAIAALKPGQMVTFEGKVDGFMMGSVMVKECMLAK